MIPELIDMIYGYIQEPQTDRLVLLVNDYFSSLFDYRNKYESIKNQGNTLFLTKKILFNKGWNWGMEIAAENGNKKLVQFFISKGACLWVWGMEGAALGGHTTLVLFFISKGANNWNYGMNCAAQGGHINLVQFFISKGANSGKWGMYWAEQGGHTKLVELFNKKLIS